MIRIGNTILNEENISYIRPLYDQTIKVFFASGAEISIDVAYCPSELDRLEQLLCVPLPQPDGIDLNNFTGEEQAAMSEAVASGYRYLARDADGHVYFYHEEPQRDGAYWNNRDYDTVECKASSLAFDALRPDKVLDMVEGRYI